MVHDPPTLFYRIYMILLETNHENRLWPPTMRAHPPSSHLPSWVQQSITWRNQASPVQQSTCREVRELQCVHFQRIADKCRSPAYTNSCTMPRERAKCSQPEMNKVKPATCEVANNTNTSVQPDFTAVLCGLCDRSSTEDHRPGQDP